MSELVWRITAEVLTALESSAQWKRWHAKSVGPETVHETLGSLVDAEAPSEQEMMWILAGDDHTGGLPAELIRKVARLAAPSAVDRARDMATQAHAGTFDKAGKPYIGHPARVAARVAGDLLAERVAWLHDVVEDTDITLPMVEREFGAATARAVDALSRREGEEPNDYYARVRANKTALKVKLADIADNFDSDRLTLLTYDRRDYLATKYQRALEQLGQTRYWARFVFENGQPVDPYFLVRQRPAERVPEWWRGRDSTWQGGTLAYDALTGMRSDSLNTEPISEADARIKWPKAF